MRTDLNLCLSLCVSFSVNFHRPTWILSLLSGQFARVEKAPPPPYLCINPWSYQGTTCVKCWSLETRNGCFVCRCLSYCHDLSSRLTQTHSSPRNAVDISGLSPNRSKGWTWKILEKGIQDKHQWQNMQSLYHQHIRRLHALWGASLCSRMPLAYITQDRTSWPPPCFTVRLPFLSNGTF